MSILGQPERKREPLRAWLMGLALVIAAALGAGSGVLYHRLSDAAEADAEQAQDDAGDEDGAESAAES